MNEEQYIGKCLTWEEAVSLFPGMWVSFKDCEFNKATFMKGTLIAVMNDKDRIEYMNEHWNDGFFISRTTEDYSGEYIHGTLISLPL